MVDFYTQNRTIGVFPVSGETSVGHEGDRVDESRVADRPVLAQRKQRPECSKATCVELQRVRPVRWAVRFREDAAHAIVIRLILAGMSLNPPWKKMSRNTNFDRLRFGRLLLF
jgi:hypothetical protein